MTALLPRLATAATNLSRYEDRRTDNLTSSAERILKVPPNSLTIAYNEVERVILSPTDWPVSLFDNPLPTPSGEVCQLTGLQSLTPRLTPAKNFKITGITQDVVEKK